MQTLEFGQHYSTCCFIIIKLNIFCKSLSCLLRENMKESIAPSTVHRSRSTCMQNFGLLAWKLRELYSIFFSVPVKYPYCDQPTCKSVRLVPANKFKNTFKIVVRTLVLHLFSIFLYVLSTIAALNLQCLKLFKPLYPSLEHIFSTDLKGYFPKFRKFQYK